MSRILVFVLIGTSLYGQHRQRRQEICFKNPKAAFCSEREWVPRPAPKEPRPSKSVIVNQSSSQSSRRRSSMVEVGTPAPPVIHTVPQAPPGNPLPPIEDARVERLTIGDQRSEVLEKLGEPHVRISGDLERYTYLLQSGKAVKLDFENGLLKRIAR